MARGHPSRGVTEGPGQAPARAVARLKGVIASSGAAVGSRPATPCWARRRTPGRDPEPGGATPPAEADPPRRAAQARRLCSRFAWTAGAVDRRGPSLSALRDAEERLAAVIRRREQTSHAVLDTLDAMVPRGAEAPPPPASLVGILAAGRAGPAWDRYVPGLAL